MSKPSVVAQGMSQAGEEAAMTGANSRFDAVLAKVKAKNPEFWGDGPAPAPVVPQKTPSVAPTPRAGLENELGKRSDWRTTDAVPIDAMKHAMGKGGSIIEAGESIPGLADRMAAL